MSDPYAWAGWFVIGGIVLLIAVVIVAAAAIGVVVADVLRAVAEVQP